MEPSGTPRIGIDLPVDGVHSVEQGAVEQGAVEQGVVEQGVSAGDGGGVELAVRAESAGVGAVWITAGEDTADHDLLQAVAQVAAVTRSVAIVAAGLAWPPASWLRAAEDLATLDALSGGRLEVALQLTPPLTAEGLAAAAEDLELVRLGWSAGPVEHESPRHRVDGVDVHPKPLRPHGPPVWTRLPSGGVASARVAQWARGGGSGLWWPSLASARTGLEADSGSTPLRTAVSGHEPLSLDEDGMAGARARAELQAAAFPSLAISDWIEAVRSDSSRSRGTSPL
jgi:hypothetical protein